MTQLWMDGLDQYGIGSSGRSRMLEGPWAEVSGANDGPDIPSFGARTGQNALKLSATGGRFVRRVIGQNEDTVIVSIGFYLPALPDLDDRVALVAFLSAGTVTQGTLYVQSDGSLTLRGPATGYNSWRSASVLASTASPALVAGSWNHIEVEFTRSATVGAIEVRVNEVVVLNAGTLNTGTVTLNQLFFGYVPQSSAGNATVPSTIHYDDFVLRNKSGAQNNDFQGDLRVATLQPIANGTNQGWTPRSIQKLGGGVLRVNDNGSRNSAVTFADNAALELGALSYTIEGFYRFEEIPLLAEEMTLASKYRTDNDARSWRLRVDGPDVGGDLVFSTSSDGTLGDVIDVHSFPFIPEKNRWYHIAVSRDGTNSRMFLDGVQIGITKTDSRAYFDGDALLAISGRMSSASAVATNTALEGWVDGFRLTVGAARYTSDFTPPTAALATTVGGDALFANVALLMNFDNDAVTDQSSNAFVGTLRNGAVLEIPDDSKAFQTIDGLAPIDFDFVEASLVAATGTLTFVDNPVTSETVTVGSVKYNFEKILEDTANNILIGATAEDSLDNLLAAVNLGAGVGTLYGTGTVVNSDAQLTDLPDEQVLAKASTPGLAGNSVVSTVAGALGVDWTIRTSAADNSWRGVVFGNGLFVAVSDTGTGNRVMTSPDGITWTIRTSAADNQWLGITFGNGLFVAVAVTGTGNRVMTSPDGITWTIRTSAADNDWRGVVFGNGLFVAAASSGTGNRVMTSPDGITWTIRTSAADNVWLGIAFGNGLFVAVAQDSVGNRVMTSPDGITWTIRTSAADNSWQAVAFGNGLFVAVAQDGIGNRVMTSPDGITWTIRTSAADNSWRGVVFGNGLFVAVSLGGIGNRVMTSPDGITWTIRTSAADNQWLCVAFGSGLFVAVAITGTGNRAMTDAPAATDMSWSGATLLGGLDIPTNSEFTISALPAEVTGVRAVAIVNRAFKTDSGSSTLQASFVKSGGTSSQGSARPITVNPTYYEDTFETDPSGGAITPSTLKDARIRLDRTA